MKGGLEGVFRFCWRQILFSLPEIPAISLSKEDLGYHRSKEMEEDNWTKEARKAAEELSPEVEAMLSGRLEVEILNWAVSREASFTLLLYDAGTPVSLMAFFLLVMVSTFYQRNGKSFHL